MPISNFKPSPLGGDGGGFTIIIITLPSFFDGEVALVNRLFRLGMQRLHLRKPNATEEEIARWIEDVDKEYLRRIVLHDHHQLAHKYKLGGIHLNGRNPNIPSWVNDNFTVSKSCHTLTELTENKTRCDYLFLSPIYDSISKEGYGAAFSHQTIKEAHQQGIIDKKVYALGGVTFEKLSQIQTMGFGGAAILGDLWMSDSPEEKFRAVRLSIFYFYQEPRRARRSQSVIL